MKSKNKLEIFLPDKYLKCNFYHPTEDDGMIGTVKYLRDQGQTCEFLGFNYLDNYVVVIDGIKYYGGIVGNIESNYYATFYVVEDIGQDYMENHFTDRVQQILTSLKNLG